MAIADTQHFWLIGISVNLRVMETHRSHPKSLTDRPSKMENYGKLLDFPFWWVWVTFQGQTLQPSKGENLKVFLFKVDASPGAFLHGQRVPVPVPLATTLGAAPQPARYPGCGEIYSKKWLDQLCLWNHIKITIAGRNQIISQRGRFSPNGLEQWKKSEYEKYDGDNLYELCK